MIEIFSVSELPQVPAVYAMYGGQGRGLYVAYVGIAGKLKNRISQHLIRRDSSVATGTSAVALLPDYVTEVHWWEYPDFDQRSVLEAAELVAFDVLDPALRSRGGIQEKAKQLYEDEDFKQAMKALFLDQKTGRLVIPTLQASVDRITQLEKRVATLERQVQELKQQNESSP